MSHILLTGAGFTQNWGAWLGNEAFEYLLGCRELDATLRHELWADKNRGLGFEATLGRLQQQATSDASGARMRQVQSLTGALTGMFHMMDIGLQERHLEFQNDMRFQLAPFLVRFDAIFTLNQDLFLERRYMPGIDLVGIRRWTACASPGIGNPARNAVDQDPVTAKRSPLPEASFAVAGTTQPYFKLHGSSNWNSADGQQMLVMGGNKTQAIGASHLLRWYWERFNFHLCRGGAKLMVIGYGFGDPHVNAAIIQAATNNGLKIFIVDPAGTDVLDRRGPNMHIKPATDELMEALQPAVIGASRRPLTATFGNDPVEHSRVVGFFDA